MTESSLISLPPEMLLEICSVLPGSDVNTMRLVFRAFRNVIDGNPKKAYCSRKFEVVATLFTEKLFMSYRDREKGRTAFITFKDGLCTKARIDNSDVLPICEELLGKYLDECHVVMMERSGGPIHLDIRGKLEQKHLPLLHNIINEAPFLRIFCHLSNIPKDIAFQYLFSQKRSLKIFFPIMIGNNNFVDDRFCKEAASHHLEIFGGDQCITMTDEQLITFIRREDISNLIIYPVDGPTAEGIRKVIQALLYTKKKCMINVKMQFLPEMMNVLLRTINEEKISIDREVRNPERVVYKMNNRTVVVSHFTDLQQGIKIESE